MLQLPFFCCFLIITLTSAASSDAYDRHFHKRRIMNSITTFIESLEVPSSQAQHLAAGLGNDPNLESFLNGKDHDTSALIKLACLSAEICLGADSVDTTPVNTTEVDNNWSVAPPSSQKERRS